MRNALGPLARHWRWLLLAAVCALAVQWLGGERSQGAAPRQGSSAESRSAPYRDLDAPVEEIRALATMLSEVDARLGIVETVARQAAEGEGQAARASRAPRAGRPAAPSSPPATLSPAVAVGPGGSALPAAADEPAGLVPPTAFEAAAAVEDAGAHHPPTDCAPPCYRDLADLPVLDAAAETPPEPPPPRAHGPPVASVRPAPLQPLAGVPEQRAEAGLDASAGLFWVGGGSPEGRYVLAPAGATLVGARLLTALIGRVPKGGALVDPVPFKAVVGRRNFFAPGVRLPGLEGALLRGEAVGDLLLSCARGRITSVSWRDAEGRWREYSDRSGLGYLTDARGSPCIGGKLFTSLYSAALWAGLQGGLSSAAAAWEASRYADGSGLAALSVRELGRAGLVKGGSSALADWIGERLDDTFDAVVVPSGRSVTAHLEVSIPAAGEGASVP